MADPDARNVNRAPSEGGEDGKYGGNEGADGYKIEIESVKGLISPLEESVIGARAVKNGQEKLTTYLQHCGAPELLESGKGFIKAWGFGMGELADHADVVVERLYEAVAGYMLAELLQIKNFWPSDENMAKLPNGAAGKWSWDNVGAPEMEKRPEDTGLSKLSRKWLREYEDES
ncbi:hypothetical protein AB0B12_27230 [Streptomyces sp. NPDC044780]|uniref:Uncharacterized protein n=1 Tax=Streptomyces luomodiensis TaxID=3026192 RepID=A0ABY9UU51_9ACTN|nr:MULTISPECIES: hypothetical protein [unclassified Streptomyces]WAP55278.1 hypothetical protein N6H00_09970 [Streptomyces sp. S465]WNE95801.1 hypothetical protein PS467_10890 [Streptomyces sp. SCA4-21]